MSDTDDSNDESAANEGKYCGSLRFELISLGNDLFVSDWGEVLRASSHTSVETRQLGTSKF